MSDIQQARDALKKWRKDPSSAAAWELFDSPGFEKHIAAGDRGYLGSIDDETDAELIVGTAGNPYLLDAIDGLLILASRLEDEGLSTAFLIRVEHIAAAIVTAEKRMQQ